MQHYSDTELTAMLNDIESDRVERKQSFSSDVAVKARQAVCGFANDMPNHKMAGVLFIGAKDDGKPSDYEISDRLLQTLADMKSDGRILPLPVLSVEKRILFNKEMAVVTVQPSDMPPVKFDGRIWIRTGSRRSLANEQEERILIERRRFLNIPYDLKPMPSASITDLSRAVFEDEYLPAAFAPDILEANGRTYEERLASCRMILTPDDPTPTVVGVLALAKEPQKFIPEAYVQILRLNGNELTDDVIDSAKILGNLKKVLDSTIEKIKAHNRVAVDVLSNPTHTLSSDYVLEAVYQILYNAILHRSYEFTGAPIQVFLFDDRIEIISPGGPYGRVTKENFGNSGIVSYRNPNIADVLKVFGFVQSFGRGIMLARRECKRLGKPEPIFDVDQNKVRCVFYKS